MMVLDMTKEQLESLYDWIDTRVQGKAKEPRHAFTASPMRTVADIVDYALTKAKNEAEQKVKDRIAKLRKERKEWEKKAEKLLENEESSEPRFQADNKVEQLTGAIAELQTLVAVSTKGE